MTTMFSITASTRADDHTSNSVIEYSYSHSSSSSSSSLTFVARGGENAFGGGGFIGGGAMEKGILKPNCDITEYGWNESIFVSAGRYASGELITKEVQTDFAGYQN